MNPYSSCFLRHSFSAFTTQDKQTLCYKTNKDRYNHGRPLLSSGCRQSGHCVRKVSPPDPKYKMIVEDQSLKPFAWSQDLLEGLSLEGAQNAQTGLVWFLEAADSVPRKGGLWCQGLWQSCKQLLSSVR
eukprot:53969-Amphidinium_carterae.1